MHRHLLHPLLIPVLVVCAASGCSSQNGEETAILDDVACPHLATPDAFWVTSTHPDIPVRRSSVTGHQYGLLTSTRATSDDGDTVELDSEGPRITRARLSLQTETGQETFCDGAGSLMRDEHLGDGIRFRARLRDVRRGENCAEPLGADIDVCFTVYSPNIPVARE